jgi:hypothetical protein
MQLLIKIKFSFNKKSMTGQIAKNHSIEFLFLDVTDSYIKKQNKRIQFHVPRWFMILNLPFSFLKK